MRALKESPAVNLQGVLAVEDVEPAPAAPGPAGGDGHLGLYLAALRGPVNLRAVDHDGRRRVEHYHFEVARRVVPHLGFEHVREVALLVDRLAVRVDVVIVLGGQLGQPLHVPFLVQLPRPPLVGDEQRLDRRVLTPGRAGLRPRVGRVEQRRRQK